MKMPLNLVRAFGVINAIFVLFHIWLGWRFHHMTHIPQGLRVLLEIFNDCGLFPILFLAIAGLGYSKDVLSTTIGRLTLWLGAAIYVSRAVLEYALSPAPSPLIAATCLVTGAVALTAIATSRSTATNPRCTVALSQ